MMNITVYTVFLFGLFSLIGGIIGYTKAGSLVSLLAGGLSGIILIISSIGIFKNYNLAFYVALVVALLLGGRFVMTLIKNFKVMPDLIMVLFSAVTIFFLVMDLIKKP
ncbi:MAG: hypothetical protein EH225_06530 [Calditrichaeota bacterium]|nr:TMEM14 family protein [Calditrichota bacterium]RQV93038.1 MAG: hypothetical protein EH221_10365 [bacterium]RQW03929.1 MAG: hypothetical protein EH225_06530 [Calditrichota bacterium]